MKRNILLSLILVTALVACSNPQPQPNSARYVVTSPELAEIITQLQGDSNIVGVTTECDFPASLKDKEKVGTFGSVSYEKILELNPSIVFTTGLEQAKLTADLNKAGIKTSSYYPKTLTGMLEVISSVGKEIGEEEAAKTLLDSLQAEIKMLRKTQPEDKPSIYVEIYDNPIMSVSDSSFVGELIEIAGLKNIFPVLPRDYSRVNQEDVIQANPDIILLTYPGKEAKHIIGRKGWENIPACKNNEIYNIEDVNPDLILRATPRIIQGIKQLRGLNNE